MTVKSWNDYAKGVEVKQTTFNKDAIICYSGLLARSGADQIYLHCGHGDQRNWKNTSTEPMVRTYKGFEKRVTLKESNLNFCFKDSANNWDNNNGHNWTCTAY